MTSMKHRDADKSASQKRKAIRRKHGDRRNTPRNPWQSPDVPSTREELAGLVQEIISKQGTGVRPPGAKLRRNQIALVVAVVLALSVTPIAWAFWPRSVEIPAGMVGRWTTTAPMYTDRSFTVAKDSVTFLTGARDSTIHPILHVRSRSAEQGTAYTIYYASFGSDLEFSIVYTDGPAPTIQFINQRGMIWKKER